MHSKIIATGSYLPKRVVTNDDLAGLMTTSDEWIREKIGTRERRFAANGEGASDLALKASESALKQAGLKPSDLDAIVFATSTPDYHAPGSGILLQNKLGCSEIPAFDVRNTSPGFLYSLDLADGLIKTKRYKTILVVASEVHSTGLDFSDRGRMMAVIFGDGAGCFILQATDEDRGLKDFILHSNGKDFNKLWCEGPSSLRNPRVTQAQIEEGIFFPTIDGRYVFQHSVKNMTAVVQEILSKHHMTVDDIDWLIAHQANLRIIKEVGKNLGIDLKKVPTNIETHGNTNSASIPILFDEQLQAGRIKSGDKIVITSFGSGFCWGAGLIEMDL